MEYKIIHPTKACGAIMRPLIPGEPELAFQEGYETTTIGEEYLPVSIGISYPCHKNYNFMMGPPMWTDCFAKGDHGHALVSCDDGMALMPHIIRTKADINHLIEDLILSRHFACYFGSDTAWEEALRYILANDPMSLSLPDGPRTYSGEFDMSRIGYWM